MSNSLTSPDSITIDVKIEIQGSLRGDLSSQPDRYVLYQNYPNPFNPSTHVTFGIHREGHVTLIVYNSIGQEVERLVEGELFPFTYEFVWRPENLPREYTLFD